tara:strand:+ start:1135 stop:1521 length:387 start_codon:yes stop_codon:yes gene_type:complete
MSTRAQIRFATREAGQSFNEHPNAIHAQFYCHSDGYPEGLGIDIAESFSCGKISGWEIELLDTKRGDLEYIYYIWQAPGKETYISIFEVDSYPDECETCGQPVQYEDACIFVGSPKQLIEKYESTNTK